jgi:exodeoxyribonuclease VII small subunit
VASASKGPAPSGGAQESLPFDQALKKLEAIVEAMEGGDLPLETMLAKFEEGTRLAKLCQSRLEEAQLKIQTLEKNAAGQPILSPPGAPPAPDQVEE